MDAEYDSNFDDDEYIQKITNDAKNLARVVHNTRTTIITEFCKVAPTNDSFNVFRRMVHNLFDNICSASAKLCNTADDDVTDYDKWLQRFLSKTIKD